MQHNEQTRREKKPTKTNQRTARAELDWTAAKTRLSTKETGANVFGSREGWLGGQETRPKTSLSRIGFV